MVSWNPNKLFGRLDIRTKLAIAFVGLAGVPLALVGWYAADQHLRSLTETATQEQRRGLASVRERVQSFLGGVEGDLELLAGSSALDALLRHSGARGGAALVHGEPSLETVEGVFRDFLRSKRYYFRLRLLSGGGVELAYVAYRDGRSWVFPPGRWRETGYPYYRTLVEGLSGRETAFAPVELRSLDLTQAEAPADPLAAEREDVAEPAVPVAALSFMRPLRGAEGGLRGILVADVDARWLFELLQPPELRAGESLVLVGPDGHYLFHSSKKTDWNTLLATERGFNLRGDLPEWMVERALSGAAGIEAAGVGSVVAFAPLFDAPSQMPDRYTLVSIIPKDVLFAPVRSLRLFIFGAGALSLLVAGGLALVAAHQFAAPIRELTHGATLLARGRFDTPLEIDTNDEIEDLAHAFSSMAGALERREREITRQGEQLNALLDNMGEGVAVIDRHYRVRFLNRFMQDRFGPPDGRSCFELFMGSPEPCDECLVGSPAGSGSRAIRTGRAADGRDYEVLTFPLEDFEGDPAWLEIHRDVTERREMERQLQRYTEHLETMVEERTRELERSQAKLVQQEKMVAVGQLAAGLAHELGTPLATILCQAEMIRDDVRTALAGCSDCAGDVNDVAGQLGAIAEEVDRCRDVVRNLLEFSRPSSGELEPISLRDVVGRARKLLERDLDGRGIATEFEVDEDARVMGNENALAQVLVNLLLNAADSMPDGGRVTVCVEATDTGTSDEAASTASRARDDGRVRIVVEDQGHGMDPEIQSRIFEPFFTTKEPGSGTGLGLWVVYNAVAEHGGRLDVESAPGRGTRFILELPRRAAGPGRHAAAPLPAEGDAVSDKPAATGG